MLSDQFEIAARGGIWMYYEVEIDSDIGRITQLMEVSAGTRCTVGQRLIGVFDGRAYYGRIVGVRLVLD